MIYKYYTEEPVSCSIHSLAQAYLANNCCLPAQIDWLHNLEVQMTATITACDRPLNPPQGFSVSYWFAI